MSEKVFASACDSTGKRRRAGWHLPNAPVVVFVLLGGCSFAPDHTRPPMPVPTVWTSPDDRSKEAAQRVEWQQFFRNASLLSLIQTALDNNRDLRIAVARVELARSEYRVQRADMFPQLSGDAAPTRLRLPGKILPGGQDITSNLFAGFLSASWEVDLWGRIRNLDEAALDNWLASDEARRAIRLSLIAEVANTWLLSREFDERIALAYQTIETRQDSVRITRRRYEIGYSPRIDLTQAESSLGQAESDMSALEREREQTRNALSVLLGVSAKEETTTLSAVENSVMPELPPGLPSDLLENRPDIREAEDQLRATEADIGAARAAFFPRIALFGQYGSASTALGDLFTNSTGAWIFGAAAAQPLFEGGRLTGNLAAAKAQRKIAVADYERTVQTAFRDVADALAARRWLEKQIEAQQRTVAALTDRAHLADLRYRAGSAPYLEVLDAQRDLFSAQQSLIATRRTRLSSEINLYAALGGGDDNPNPSTADNLGSAGGWFP